MPKLFGVDIAAAINAGIGPGLLPCTVTQVLPGTRAVGNLTAGQQPTTTDYQTTGFIDDYTEYQLANSSIQTGDRKVIMMGTPLSNSNIIPGTGDIITIEGQQYKIVKVKRDPAGATYECQVRGLGAT